jgi:hypothetical protein
MATTTNYSWSTPDNTSYVKDGASSIRTLGSSVDTTLFTALGGAYPGLRLVKKQTIGSGVSTVTVTDAFSSTYENYKVVVSGGAGSTVAYLSLQLGGSTTEYYGSLIYSNYTTSAVLGAGTNNVANFRYAGTMAANGINVNAEVNSPFLAKNASIRSHYYDASVSGVFTGYHNSVSSFTSLTLIPFSGTLTGGTIYVYGYGAS